jgi:putative glycerol-1-phosphate prenyltransferase
MNIFSIISGSAKGKHQMALLIDPDKTNESALKHTIQQAEKNGIDFFFVGGSLVFGSVNSCIRSIKSQSSIPVILFPGNVMQLSSNADALLFLSLISGRNPEFLIGHHVLAAPAIKESGIEVIPTGYILIENGQRTSVEYMSNTAPIPYNKPEIAVATALAGEMLGLKMIYLEAGSGAAQAVGLDIIRNVRASITIPLIVGGGIKTAAEMKAIYTAGANLIVIGTAVEENPEIIDELAAAR